MHRGRHDAKSFLTIYSEMYENTGKTYQDPSGINYDYLKSKKQAIAVTHSKDLNAFIDFSGEI